MAIAAATATRMLRSFNFLIKGADRPGGRLLADQENIAHRHAGLVSLPRYLARGIALIAAAHFALFGYFLMRTAILSPISDMFAYIDVYLRFRAGDISLVDYLWRAHGEHHLVWIRLLTWADVELFHTRSVPFVIAATAAIVTSAVLVWRQLRHAQPKLGAATSMGLLAPMLMLSTANVTDCSVPINTTYTFTVFFAVLALVLFAGAKTPGSGADLRRLGAVLAAFGASMGTAVGLLTWPILLWVAWRERLNRGWLATMAGLSVIYNLFYARDLFFLGLQPALHKDPASFVDAAHLYSMSYYFFTFLGLPFTREPSLELIGFAIGGTLFLAGSYAVVIATSTNRLTTQLDRIATGMILLAFGSAAMAAVGRSDLSDGLKVPVRYTMFATMLQVGLLCLILPRAVRRFDSVQGRVFLCAIGLIFAVVLLVMQGFIGRSAAQIAAVISRDADCYAQGPQSGSVNPVVTHYPDDAAKVLAALRQQGLLAPRSRDCTAD